MSRMAVLTPWVLNSGSGLVTCMGYFSQYLTRSSIREEGCTLTHGLRAESIVTRKAQKWEQLWLWRQVLETASSHIVSSWNRDQSQSQAFLQPPAHHPTPHTPLATHFLKLGSTTPGLHTCQKSAPARTKCSDVWACGRHFTSRSEHPLFLLLFSLNYHPNILNKKFQK